MTPRFLAALVSLMVPGVSTAEPSTFDVVQAGKTCHVQKTGGAVECTYKVGRDLVVTIAGVGETDASITFPRSNSAGDYYATFGLAHGCIIVKPGDHSPNKFPDFAFISPRNGKVYGSWEGCRAGR
jgi:hypothetical protein